MTAVPGTGQDEATYEIAPDLAYQRLGIVNVIFYGLPKQDWVLIDAGLPGTAGMIRKAAAARFGVGVKPKAIVLTHGHFDHIGALRDLAEGWNVPIYAHRLEPDTLPKIMNHIAEVRSGAEGQTHWQMKLPLGQSLEWDTRVTEERRDELSYWRSLEGAALPNEGRVTFRPAPAERGTVTLKLEFNPPGGALGSAVAKQFEAVPKNLVSKALRRFKSLAETGEMPTLSSNPSARGRGDNV